MILARHELKVLPRLEPTTVLISSPFRLHIPIAWGFAVTTHSRIVSFPRSCPIRLFGNFTSGGTERRESISCFDVQPGSAFTDYNHILEHINNWNINLPQRLRLKEDTKKKKKRERQTRALADAWTHKIRLELSSVGSDATILTENQSLKYMALPYLIIRPL